MRWPFHFGKAARAESGAATEPVAPPRRHDWASIAPIQRAIGDAPLTAPSLEFSRGLAGSEKPPLRLEALGHHRTLDGPQGLVMGITNPIESYGSSVDLVGRPPRRRGEAPAALQAASDELSIAAPTESGFAVPDQEVEPGLPRLALPVVAAETQGTMIPPGRLTDAGSVALGPLRPVQRSAETATAPPPTGAGTSPVVNQPPASPPAGRLNLGLSRRHGLGAPIRAADAAAVQRSTQPPSSPVSTEHEVEVPRSETPLAADLPPLPITDTRLASLPPYRRHGGPGRSEEPDSSVSADAVEPAVVAASAGPQVQMLTVPTVLAAGSAGVSIQRLTGSPASPTGPRERTPLSLPLTSLRPPLTSARLPTDLAVTGMPEGQWSSPFAILREMPQPAVQRTPVRTWSPSGRDSGPSAAEAFRAPGQRPLVWNVQRLEPAETPPGEPTAGAPSAGESPGPGAPMMASAPAIAPAAPGAAAQPGGGVAGVPQAGEVAPAGGSAGIPAGGAAPHGEKEIHELAQALFHPLMSLLRREVLTERERAGFVTDLR